MVKQVNGIKIGDWVEIIADLPDFKRGDTFRVKDIQPDLNLLKLKINETKDKIIWASVAKKISEDEAIINKI